MMKIGFLRPDPGDQLDAADRKALHEALAESAQDIAEERLFDAEQVLAELRELSRPPL
ncbi:MAG TPA: hypothetical protein VGE98_11110 [Thermoanaerobaculia bacterium]